MWRCFSKEVNTAPFLTVAPEWDMNEKNVAVNEWQRLSETFDLTKEDAVPDLEFNRVLWHGIKGSEVPFPGPRRAAFISVKDSGDDEEEEEREQSRNRKAQRRNSGLK